MKKSLFIGVLLVLTACSPQLNAHELSTPKIISPEEFKPLTIKNIQDSIYDRIETPPPVKSVVKQPVAKKRTEVKLPKVVANTSPKKYALQRVGAVQFNCLDALWTRESNWNYRAYNRSSGAYGIPQALPGSKMASAGDDWRTNPITQVKWGINYVNVRYGSACGAWRFWQRNHWY